MVPFRFRHGVADILSGPLCSRLLFLLFFCLTVQPIHGMSPPPPPGQIRLDGHLNTSCIPHSGGIVYLVVGLSTDPEMHALRARRQMNLAVVLDRSGSMADERKFEYAKEAVCTLLDHLTGEDYLSIVVYDDRVETLLPQQRVRDREQIKAMLAEVYPRGSTNLGGGMDEGFRQIERNFRPGCVNRVILLSDGLANRGITDPEQLDEIARGYREKSISLSTIGVGLEYNENLMLGLSRSGGGNYYFVETPRQLASIFENEFTGMGSVLAQNAAVEITPGPGVEIRDVIGAPWRPEGNRASFTVGDVYAGDRREWTVELVIPEGTGELCAARGLLRCDCFGGPCAGAAGFEVDIHYTDSDAELMKGKDWDVQGKADLSISTRGVEKAMKALDEGRRDEAQRELNAASVGLVNSPAIRQSAEAAPLLRKQAVQIQGFMNSVILDSTDLRLLKKSMQYQNYKTQRQKK